MENICWGTKAAENAAGNCSTDTDDRNNHDKCQALVDLWKQMLALQTIVEFGCHLQELQD